MPVRKGSSKSTQRRASRSKTWLHSGSRLSALVMWLSTEALTGTLTSASSNMWDRIRGKQLGITVTADLARAERNPLDYVGYVIPQAPEDSEKLEPPPPFFSESPPPVSRAEWANKLRGGDANETWVQVTILGRSRKPVILQNMRIKVLERRPPPKGIHVIARGGEGVFVRWLSVNLDTTPPVITASKDDRFEVEGDPKDAKPVTFPFRVSDTQPEVFYVVAETRQCDCTWVIELYWVANGREGTSMIDDNGKPFRTIASRNSKVYESTFGEKLKPYH